MIDPVFSNDFHQFVFQDPSALILPPVGIPKLFDILPSQKSKKDLKKEKSPWLPKPPQDEKNEQL